MESEHCTECAAPGVWVRNTQFAGDHYYCDYHAQFETDCTDFMAVSELNARHAEQELLRANRSVRLDPMPQRRGRSKQDFGTPKALLKAVEKRYGPIGWDLAACGANAVVGRTDVPTDSLAYDKRHFDEKDNSLNQDWSKLSIAPGQVAWLNPPFADIRPWAKKLAECAALPRWTIMLVPASIGSAWYAEHLDGKVLTLGISPRLTFVGADEPYPKDLLLACAGFSVSGFGTWRWDCA